MQNQTIYKDAFVAAFMNLYQLYQTDQIYACALVLNKFLLIDNLAISTQRSIFAEDEDSAQYLAENDRWNTSKWRYRATPMLENSSNQTKSILSDHLKTPYMIDSAIQHAHSITQQNNLAMLLSAFQQAIITLKKNFAIEVERILFFISLPTQPEIEISSAHYLNTTSPLLQNFLDSKQQSNIKSLPKRMKLTQSDKDMLIDLAQIIEIQPYHYLQVANDAYLLTLDRNYHATNPYIQKLIESIVAMTSAPDGTFAMEKDEILQRINQFYHNAEVSTDALLN